jgi:hypothetical protein
VYSRKGIGRADRVVYSTNRTWEFRKQHGARITSAAAPTKNEYNGCVAAPKKPKIEVSCRACAARRLSQKEGGMNIECEDE